jgi:hypothetical protein
LPDEYRWEDERDRNLELMALLLVQSTGMAISAARELSHQMSHFGYFVEDGKAAMKDFLTRAGLGDEIAGTVAKQIAEVLHQLGASHRTPQQIIREHSRQLLADLEKTYQFSTLSTKAKHELLATWLQTTMDLPIMYESDSVREYCSSRGISTDALIHEADKVHMNLAVVDDLTELWHSSRAQPVS